MTKIYRLIMVGCLAVSALLVPLVTTVYSAPKPSTQQRLALLEAAMSTLQAQSAAQQTQITTLQTTIATLQGQLASANNTISSLGTQLSAAQGTLTTLQSDVTTVQANHSLALDPYVSVDMNTINGVAGPHVIFTGANVHIRNGSGTTDTTNGLGNLIIGYNENKTFPIAIGPGILSASDSSRQGSHNIIDGVGNSFSSWAGFVVGFDNTISAPYASVSGGESNTASGRSSSVSGGGGNNASGALASVSGGGSNTASGDESSVSGGIGNTGTTTSALGSWVAGSGDLFHAP